MPVRAGGESAGEARERERQRRQEQRRQPPTAPAPRAQPIPQPVPTPTTPTPRITPTPGVSVPAAEERATRERALQRRQERRRAQKDPREWGFQMEWWEPKPLPTPGGGKGRVRVSPEGEPVPVEPKEFDPVEAAKGEFTNFVEMEESLTSSSISGLPPGLVLDATDVMPSQLLPQTGRQADLLDAALNRFWVSKNLEAYLQQYKAFDPDWAKDFEAEITPGSRHSATAIASSGAGSPLRAMWRALEDMAEARPDTYTQYMATEAGRAELFANALMRMVSPPKEEFSILTPGENAGDIIDNNMADVPFLKQALINTVEIAGDPVLIGALVAFPPAGFAAKAKLGTQLAVGMGIGEEAAEELGAPPLAGALVGGLAAPVGYGFFRAGVKASLRNALHNPVPGEPATEMLVRGGKLPGDGGQLMFHGTSPEAAREILSKGLRGADDLFLTTEPDLAAQFARRGAAAGEAAPATVLAVEVPEGVQLGGREAIRTVRAADTGQLRTLAELSGEEAALTGAQFTERLNPYYRAKAALGLKPIAGGADVGPTLASFREQIFVHIERPEARDFLRLLAGKVADYIPLGGGKRIQEIINRMGVAEAPELKAAFGFALQNNVDTAARNMTMASFRGGVSRFGKAVPILENDIGQVWVRTKAATEEVARAPSVRGGRLGPAAAPEAPRVVVSEAARRGGNLFRKGEGEWIATGDVNESILRGEQTYIGRVPDEYVAFVKEADAAMRPYMKWAEQATGLTIQKRDVWWPRYMVDPTTKKWTVTGAGKGKPSMLKTRIFDDMQDAIATHGRKYSPNMLDDMEQSIAAAQRLTREGNMAKYMREEGILRTAGEHGPLYGEEYAKPLGSQVIGVLNTAHLRDMQTILGPGTKVPLITQAEKVNAVARMMLTGSLDTGWGAIQLLTLAALKPELWGEAMARGFYNAIVEPKQFYRYLARAPEAQKAATYGVDIGFSSEMFEAARMGGMGLPRIPLASPVIDVATFPARAFLNRLQVGFDASLAYGRILAFDTMAEVAAAPGIAERATGARALEGQALHEELFRLARFTNTLIGQPKLGGVISRQQHQIESAFMFFATRYTRSMLGTLSYAIGKGYTPTQARAIMAKMMIGGLAINSGLIAAHGVATGKSEEEILSDITTSLNPQSGKKFMSIKMGKDWYGLGGTYRSQIGMFGQMADKENWDFETWEEATFDNPLFQGWRSRTSPVTGTLIDFLEGEDFLGHSVNFWEFVDDPRKAADYAIDRFAPITVDALLQDGSAQRKTARFIAEFFGLRTSPETAWEALQPVMNRVSQYVFGVPFEGLEHNMPAQDFVKNHPDVVAVTEGSVRPIRDRERERFWKKYRKGRDIIRYKQAGEKGDIEASYVSGRMDGSDYREQYGDIQSAEFYELLGFKEGLGVEFETGEAPTGSVNAALDAYFQIDLDNYRDPETREVDYEAYFADRDAAIAQVPEKFQPLVEQWLQRRESAVRRSFRTNFEQVIEPTGYFQMREQVAATLGVSLDDIESSVIQYLKGEEVKRVAPVDVAKLTDKILNNMMEDTYGEDAPNLSDLKQALREINPALDIELFRQGFSTTVRSEAAQELALRYMQLYPDMGYFVPDLAADVAKALEREEEE